jgi:hypothetical protein
VGGDPGRFVVGSFQYEPDDPHDLVLSRKRPRKQSFESSTFKV